MALTRRAGLAVTLAVMLSAVAGSAAQERPVWTGQDSAYRVEWTRRDITATRLSDGKQVFSMRAFAAAQLDVSMRQETSAAGTLTRDRSVSVVSLFGPLLALRDDIFDDFKPSAHPSERVRFWTIDLSAPAKDGFDPSDQFGAAIGQDERGRIRSLDQLIPAQAIANALGRDKVLRSEIPKPPHDLDELLTTWRDQAGSAHAMALARGEPGGKGPCYDVPEDILTSFAIIGRQNAQVAVRLGLPGAGACHSAFTELGLVLPLSGDFARIARGASMVVTPPAGLTPLKITTIIRER